MRLCLYTDTALPTVGGQEFVVDALARQFTSLGHDVVVLAPRPGHPWWLADHKLPYQMVRHPRFFSMRRGVEWYRSWLLRLNRLHRFDVIHCHGLYPTGYLASLYRDELRIPIVLTSHGSDVHAGWHRLAEPLLYHRHVAALRGADALIAISRFTRERYERLCPDAQGIVDIPNGVDCEAFAAFASRPADLPATVAEGGYAMFLGRLDRQKGADVLLHAASMLPAEHRIRLVIAGDGRERPSLERLAKQLKLEERVVFLGKVCGTKKAYLLQNARCLVVPSREWEAFGMVVLESYAAGRPVIATELAGLSDLVEPGRTGWLVPPDSPADLAAALQTAFDGGWNARAFRRAALRFARRHDWTEIARRHLDLYEDLRRGHFAPAQACQADEGVSREDWGSSGDYAPAAAESCTEINQPCSLV
jgi:glycosyltransferase involved in cell wall biosynthesis